MNKFTQQTTWIKLTNIILSKKKKRKPQCHKSTDSSALFCFLIYVLAP